MKIAVIMGSNSDYTTMIETCKLLDIITIIEMRGSTLFIL